MALEESKQSKKKIEETTKVDNTIKTEKVEEKKEEKKQEKKVEVKKVKRDYALVNGLNLSISTKESGHICDMIRYKNIDDAIKMVEEVIVLKRPVKMPSREYPHQHGRGVAGAGYPINVAKEFVKLLKQLKANAIYSELELENYIVVGNANKASRPYKRGGARMKRTHLMLKLVKNERINKNQAKKQPKTENKTEKKEAKK